MNFPSKTCFDQSMWTPSSPFQQCAPRRLCGRSRLQIPEQGCKVSILCRCLFGPAKVVSPCKGCEPRNKRSQKLAKHGEKTRAFRNSFNSPSNVFSVSSNSSFSSFTVSTWTSKSSTTSQPWLSSSSLAVLTLLRGALAFFLDAFKSNSFCFSLTWVFYRKQEAIQQLHRK